MIFDQKKFGQFIDFRAFCECIDLEGESARLPSWNEIQKLLPNIVFSGDVNDARRIFVTHRWDGFDHPDPTGWQLRALRSLGNHYNYSSDRLCLWYDFMSLPQKPRNSSEEEIFQLGLGNIRELVGKSENVVLISSCSDSHAGDLKSMIKRGWVVAELYIARQYFKIPFPIYQREKNIIQYGRMQNDWDAVVPDLNSVAPLDSPESLHAWFDCHDVSCTNGSDLEFLSRQIFEEFHKYPDSGPVAPIEYNKEICIDSQDMIRLAVVSSNGISRRFPHLFLKNADYNPKEEKWTVVFVHRPPALKFYQWHDLSESGLSERLIDKSKCNSPMYPGVRFEFSSDGKFVRPYPA